MLTRHDFDKHPQAGQRHHECRYRGPILSKSRQTCAETFHFLLQPLLYDANMQFNVTMINAFMQRDWLRSYRQNAPMTDKQRIRAWYGEVLRETGWSAAHWARLAKTSPTNITRLQKDPDAAAPRTETLQKLFRVLPQLLRDKAPNILFGDAAPAAGATLPGALPYIPGPSRTTVPLLGAGGSEVAWVKAPPSLLGVRGAYALYAGDDSMEPRYFEGDMVYVNPVQPARVNDFVVVRLTGGNMLIRRLIGRTERLMTFERYRPAGVEEVERAAVAILHRILNNDELWR